MKQIWFKPLFTRQFRLSDDESETLLSAQPRANGNPTPSAPASGKNPEKSITARRISGNSARRVRAFNLAKFKCKKRARNGRNARNMAIIPVSRSVRRRRIALKLRRTLDRYGYYAAVGICAIMVFTGAAAGVMGYGGLNETAQSPAIGTPAPTFTADELTGDISSAQASSGSGLLQGAIAATAPQSETAPSKLVCWPLEGDIITRYSMDSLIYLKTLNVYGTHNGIDIAATQGQVVAACADGTVARVWRESMLGNVVEIKHKGGLVTRYASLMSLDLAKEGAAVKAGDIIGAAGTSAMSESLMGPHLHFEVFADGVNVPPTEWLE